MDRTVRNAAKALIIKDDKMLAIKISDGKEEWYIMPGGGQDVEELLPEAVCREVAEEMGLRVVVKDLAFVIEGLHGEKFHRVDLVFLCEYIGKLENAVLQFKAHRPVVIDLWPQPFNKIGVVITWMELDKLYLLFLLVSE